MLVNSNYIFFCQYQIISYDMSHYTSESRRIYMFKYLSNFLPSSLEKLSHYNYIIKLVILACNYSTNETWIPPYVSISNMKID